MSTWTIRKNLLTGFAGLAALVLGIAVVRAPMTSAKQLTVIGSLLSMGDHSEIKGRVLRDGDAVAKVHVWGIVEYANGQHHSPSPAQTDEKGGFSIGSVPSSLGTVKNVILKATIYGRKEIPGPWYSMEETTLRGEDTVLATGPSSQATVALSPLKLLPLPLIFLISVMLPLFREEPTRATHLWTISLAFVFTGLMIVYLSLGLAYVNTLGKSKDILALGFASIYESTYVKGVQPEWAFSFTAPPPTPPEHETSEVKQPASDATPAPSTAQAAATGPSQDTSIPTPKLQPDTRPIDHGFGAPLWVLLVSVIGAGILTVGLIVAEIRDLRLVNQQPDKIRERLQLIVKHQFYILFAPVGAIFVYQILVAASAASSSLTVAFAAFGAGASLSGLLKKAVAESTKLIGGGPVDQQDGEAQPQEKAGE